MFHKVDSVSSIPNTIASTTASCASSSSSSAASTGSADADRRVRFVEETPLEYVDCEWEDLSVQDLWYSAQDYKLFERATLEQARILQQQQQQQQSSNDETKNPNLSWARTWLKVFFILRTATPSNKMQAAVNSMQLSLDADTVGLQGHYLAPICVDMVARRKSLMTHMRNVQTSISDPNKRTVMIRETSKLYSHASRLYAILAAHVAANNHDDSKTT